MRKSFALIKNFVAAGLFMLIFAGYSRAAISISGTITSPQNGGGGIPVAGALVNLMGSNISATTDDSGIFILNNVPANSTGIELKISGSGYITCYTPLTGVSNTNENLYMNLISTTFYNNIKSALSGIGKTQNSGQGLIVVDVQDSSGNPVSGATISAVYLDNNQSAGNPVYFDSNGNPSATLTSTSSQGMALFLNIGPNRPVRIITSASGYVFPTQIAVGYPDQLTLFPGNGPGANNLAIVAEPSGVGLQQFSGTLYDTTDINTQVSDNGGANIYISGTNLSSTTASNGSFSFSNLWPDSPYVVKSSKTNYIDTYKVFILQESSLNQNLKILSQSVYNTVEASLGITHTSGDGDISGGTETQDGNSIAGATASLYNTNNDIVSGSGAYYFDENNLPNKTLTTTTSNESFIFTNLSPGIYWMTAAKQGFEFPINAVMVFSNGIFMGDLKTNTQVGSLFLAPTNTEPPAANILNNAANIPLLQFNLSSDNSAENVIVQSITFTLNPSSTGSLSAISNAHLLLDSNGNGTFATDEGAGTISGNTITFSGLNITVGQGLPGQNNYEVIFNFNGTAAVNNTFSLEIARNSDIISKGETSNLDVTTSGQIIPITGNMMTIVSAPPPATPTNISPADGATGITPSGYTLTASAFNAGSGNTTHSASQWQIRQAGDTNYNSPAFDSGTTDTTNLTSISPSQILANSTTYYWHVRYQNGANVWSSYSQETSFTTAASGGLILPGQPVNTDPTNGETGISLTPTLTASAFVQGSSPTQTAADWQITTTSGNYTSPVFDTGVDTSIANFTTITIPSSSALNYSTTYYWRVKYRDANNSWSPWSAETSFITKQAPITPISGGGSSGGIPVAPLAIGLSAVLIWLKRKQ